jgi:hypothetical protein
MMDGDTGVAAMVACAVKLGQMNVETLSIWRGSLAPANSCVLELCGAHIFYSIKLDNGWLSLSIQLMDGPSDSLELLVTFGDNPNNWKANKSSCLRIRRERNHVDKRTPARDRKRKWWPSFMGDCMKISNAKLPSGFWLAGGERLNDWAQWPICEELRDEHFFGQAGERFKRELRKRLKWLWGKAGKLKVRL